MRLGYETAFVPLFCFHPAHKRMALAFLWGLSFLILWYQFLYHPEKSFEPQLPFIGYLLWIALLSWKLLSGGTD